MKKIFSLFAALLFVGSMWGAIADGTYVLCTSTSDLVENAHYIITNGTSGTVKCISNVSNNSNRKTVGTTVDSNGKITVGSSSTIMTFTLGGSSGAWTFHTDNYAGTAGYLASAASGNNNYCRVISDATTCTVSFSSSAAVITLNPHSSRNILRYNNSDLFACYSTGQNAVYLYKQVVKAKSAVTIGSHEGGSLEITGAADLTKVEEGTELTVTATPNAENHYIGGVVKVTKTSDASDVTSTVLNGSTLTMPAYAVTVSATFTATYKINLVAEGGSIALDYTAGGAEEGYAIEGTVISAEATADGTHTFKSFAFSENVTSPSIVGNVATFTMPAAAVTVTATFDEVKDPAINVDETALAFGSVDINSEAEDLKQTFHVSGVNLSEGTLTIASNNEAFTVSPTSINVNGTLAATEVTVTPVTSAAGTFNGKITISGVDELSKEVSLSLTVNKLAAGISWAEDSKVGVLGEAYTHPTLNNPNSLMVSLSSTNKSVADFEEGQIVLKAAGTTTIKATSVETSVYAQGEVSYTLTVKEKYTITWHVNGATSTTKEVQGDIITPIADPVLSSDYEEKVFVGWLTTTLVTTDEAPEFVDFSALAASKDADYYAVFATYVASTEKILLSEEFDNELTSDATQAISSEDFDNFSGATSKAYKGAYGTLKFGTGSYTGYITTKDLDLSEPFTVSLKVKKYNTDDADIAITVDDEDAVTIAAVKDITSNFKVFSKKFDAATEASAIKIGTSGGNRAYIDSVVVKTGEPESYSAYSTTVAEKTYEVTFTAVYEHGTIVILNGDEPIASGAKFVKGTELTVEATPASGYQLATLTANGENIKDTKTFTVDTEDVEIVATFSSATGVDNAEASEKVVKSMENGVLIIRRGDKTYNGQGQLIK